MLYLAGQLQAVVMCQHEAVLYPGLRWANGVAACVGGGGKGKVRLEARFCLSAEYDVEITLPLDCCRCGAQRV